MRTVGDVGYLVLNACALVAIGLASVAWADPKNAPALGMCLMLPVGLLGGCALVAAAVCTIARWEERRFRYMGGFALVVGVLFALAGTAAGSALDRFSNVVTLFVAAGAVACIVVSWRALMAARTVGESRAPNDGAEGR